MSKDFDFKTTSGSDGTWQCRVGEFGDAVMGQGSTSEAALRAARDQIARTAEMATAARIDPPKPGVRFSAGTLGEAIIAQFRLQRG